MQTRETDKAILRVLLPAEFGPAIGGKIISKLLEVFVNNEYHNVSDMQGRSYAEAVLNF